MRGWTCIAMLHLLCYSVVVAASEEPPGLPYCAKRTASLRSPDSDPQYIAVFVTNRSNQPLSVHWITPNYNEEYQGSIPAGEGVSAVLKARKGNYYRFRNAQQLILMEAHTITNNMKLIIEPCRGGEPMPTPLAFTTGSQTVGVMFDVTVGSPIGSTATLPRSDDSMLKLNFTLSDLAVGINTTYNIIRNAKCPVCDGFGALPDQRHMCVACNGTGYHKHTSHLHGLTHYDVTTPTHTHAADTGDYDTVESDSIITQLSHHNCRACGGYGVIPDVPCPACGGARYTQHNVSRQVYIPPGADTQYAVTLHGLGPEEPFKTPGDFKLVVDTLPHEKFTRNGSDLIVHVELSLREALLGWNRSFVHPNGTEFRVKVSSTTTPDTELRFKGRGMPILTVHSQQQQHHTTVNNNDSSFIQQNGVEHGDLVVVPRIQLISSLSKEAEERMAELVDDGNGHVKRVKRTSRQSDLEPPIVANNTVICEDPRKCNDDATAQGGDGTGIVTIVDDDGAVDDLDGHG